MDKLSIFVYGTLRDINEPHLSELKKYCVELGKEIARSGHSIVTVSSVDIVVEKYFLDGMNLHGGNAIICRSNDPEFPFHEDNFKNIKFTFIDNLGQLNNSHINSLKRCDVVLTISGTHGLDPEIGYQTVILDKPILPLPFFGYSAQRVWESIVDVYRAKNILSEQEISDINRGKEICSPKSVIKLLEKVSIRYRKASRKYVSPKSIFLLTICMFTLWVIAFTKPDLWGLNKVVAFFTLLGASSLIGTLLRISKKMVFDEIFDISGDRLVGEITTGLLLGFIFSLGWIFNNFIVTGGGLSFPNETDFIRTSIICSLLAVGVSYSMENSINIIKSLVTIIGK